jgi:hypothetical protein
MKIRKFILGAFVLFAAFSVSAAVITFDFNAPVQTGASGWNSGVTTDGLVGANVTGLNAYMNSILAGSTVSGALATRNYNGDGFVIPGDPTLGTSDGATAFNDATHNHANTAPYDGFLMNNNFPVLGQPASNQIMITIPAGTALYTVAFDWEIFPDNNCSSGNCLNNSADSNFPTLVFKVDGAAFSGSTFIAKTSTALGGTAQNPIDPQNLGTASFALNIAASASSHTLTFVDWPPEIGIDNLKIYTCPPRGCVSQQVPEPSPLSLAGLALVLLALVRWKTTRRTASIIAG